MSLRWRRVNHWKNIRMLVADNNQVYAYIQRGRRPNEYTLVFPSHTFAWSMRHGSSNEQHVIPPYTLVQSNLEIAKAVGNLIVKTQALEMK
jgi:hypothetical protein